MVRQVAVNRVIAVERHFKRVALHYFGALVSLQRPLEAGNQVLVDFNGRNRCRAFGELAREDAAARADFKHALALQRDRFGDEARDRWRD